MRIGFMGAGGTGKSTTLKELTDIDLPVLGSVTRSIMNAEGVASEAEQESWGPRDKWNLQKKIFQARIDAESELDEFISDRTMIDHLAYCLVRCYDGMTDEELSWARDIVTKSMSTYTFLFYFPISFVPESDGLRQSGESYRRLIDHTMLGIAYDLGFGMELVNVGSKTPQDRANIVRELYTNRLTYERKHPGDHW